MDELERLKKNVREISWAQGRTLTDLRKEAGVSIRFERMPSKASLEKLSAVLQVDPPVLLQKNAIRILYGRYCFRQNLWDLIISTGKTAPEVARDLHIGKTTIYMWLNEARLPQPEMLRRVSEYFGVTTTELLFQEHSYGEVING